MRILSNSAKFSAGRPLLPAYNFSAAMASTSSTYRLGTVVSLKFSAIENMPPISVKLHIVYKNIKFRFYCPISFRYRYKSHVTARCLAGFDAKLFTLLQSIAVNCCSCCCCRHRSRRRCRRYCRGLKTRS